MAYPKIIIDRTKLNYLYWTKKLSTGQIAEIFSCNHVTILNKLKKFDIERRTRLGNRKPVIILAKILKKLYVDKRLSENQIAQRLACSRHAVEVRMKFFDIKPRSYRESNTKYPKSDFSNNLLEKAYLIGFRLGDLSVSRRGYLIHVGCSSTIEAQVNLIKSLFSHYTFVYTKPSRILNEKQVIDIQCLLNESFKFLLPKQDIIDKWILNNLQHFFAFVAGYIDAEGHIFTRLNKGERIPNAGIQIGTYDKNILHQMWKKMNQTGIECPKPIMSRPAGYLSKNGLRTKKACWRLSISKKLSLKLLFTKIKPHIKHEKRMANLNTAYDNVIARMTNIQQEN